MQPPPAPRVKSKMDSLIFMPDSIRTANVEEHGSVEWSSSSVSGAHNGKGDRETTEKEVEDEVAVENVERPVDLYKAIFSDDSDGEEENNSSNPVEDTEKKIDAANTTLNRLMAGDFLESLGKELGLLVPPEMPPPENKSGTRVAQKEAIDADERNEGAPLAKTTMSADHKVGQSSRNGDSAGKNSYGPWNIQSGNYNLKDPHSDNIENSKVPAENARRSMGKARHLSSSSSSEDERSRKHSRSRRRKSRRSSSPEMDSSDDSDVQDRRRSRSRRDDKETSRGKSSRRHSKHTRKDSPSRSHRSSEHERRKRKKKKCED